MNGGGISGLGRWRHDLGGLNYARRRFEFVCVLMHTFFGCGSRHSTNS